MRKHFRNFIWVLMALILSSMAVMITGAPQAHAAGAGDTAITARLALVQPNTRQMSCMVSCDTPSPGNDAIVRTVTPTRFGSIYSTCLTFTFAGDLVDAGETLLWTVSNNHAFGFIVGIDDPSVTTRTSCLQAGFHDQDIAEFLDGRQVVNVYMFGGSSNLVSVSLTIVGTPLSH